MSTLQEQNIDVVGILSSAIAISGPTSSATVPKNKTKTVPHKAGKTMSSSTGTGAKKRSWMKPADKPKRPLSAYNLFFKAERARLISGGTSSAGNDDPNSGDAKRKHRKTHGKIGFAALAQNIAGKWKTLSAKDRRPFEQKAAVEKARYRKELEAWQQVQKEKKLNEPAGIANAGSPTGNSSSNNAVPDSPVSSSDAAQLADSDKMMSNASDSTTSNKQKKKSTKRKNAVPKEPLSLPSSMPFYPMNLKGSPTTANIAPITLQNLGMSSLAVPMATTASMMPPMSLDASMSYGLLQDDTVAVTPSGSCGNSDVEYDDDAERDILSDVADSSMLDESFGGLLPGLPVFPTIGAAATGTSSADGIASTAAEEEKMLMQTDAFPAMDKLMSEAF